MFYQSVHLFSTQAACDRIVDKVVGLLGCDDRLECGIVASPRGIFSGALTLTPPASAANPNPQAIRGILGTAMLIPTEISGEWTAQIACGQGDAPCTSGGHVVIVVEKEAVFRALLQLRLPLDQTTELGGKMIFVTGKGYPDQAARTLVKLLSESTCSRGGKMRVVGLFDGDPFGVDIWRQYAHILPCTSGVEWLGVDIADFLRGQETDERREYPLVPLRNDERAKAVRMLRTLGDSHDDDDDEVAMVVRAKRRLTSMLLCGYKVEIEAAYDYPSGGLGGYLSHKLELLGST